ncbi:MAG: hypothetical protein AB7U73_21940 [Pirellulales bacterium]
MSPPPATRRWFQIRLSTAFFLTTIAAGFMACRPWLIEVPYVPPLSPSHVPNPLALVPTVALLLFVLCKSVIAGRVSPADALVWSTFLVCTSIVALVVAFA